MSRTRFIYFLSAIVLIIGCFALNTSYSLFVDNDSTQVETTVPTITDEVTLSLSSVEVEGTKEYLIKQTITNNNSIPVGFRLTASSDSTTYQVQATTYKDDTYLSYGTVDANTSKDIYLKVSNISEDTSNIATINFSLKSDYATLKMNTDEYLASANIDNQTQFEIVLGDLPYSDNQDTLTYKIIKRQADRNGVGLSSLFPEQNSKVTLPIESSFNVPTLTTVTNVETEDVGLYQAEDDYGTSYFYRGANDYNYVDFAGFTWRIVRINGDGSIRLILDGTLNTVKHNQESTYIYENENLQSITTDGVIRVVGFEKDMVILKDAGYTGYMYGEFQDIVGDSMYNATGGSTSYDEAHSNKKSSQIKEYIEKFYEIYLAEYESDYMADTLFCGDKTRSQNNLTTGYGVGSFSWRGYDRLANESIAIPSLKCVDPNIIADTTLSESQLAYSRYTSKLETSSTTSKNILINNDLTYPIGLLSFDEAIMAGAFYKKENNNFYLKTADSWFTMTPSIKPSSINLSQYVYIEKNGMSDSLAFGIARPVINLKSTVLWKSGDGTEDTPYTIKINEEA